MVFVFLKVRFLTLRLRLFQTTILDGRNGKALIDPPMKDTVGAQASAVTISMEGRGNDIFLYWAADCKEHSGEGGEFHFVTGTTLHQPECMKDGMKEDMTEERKMNEYMNE